MTGSTYVAIDIIFSDGIAPRNLTVRDLYANPLTPVNECNHLQPDQWNYVTAKLSCISGKTVSRIEMLAPTNPAVRATMEAATTLH